MAPKDLIWVSGFTMTTHMQTCYHVETHIYIYENMSTFSRDDHAQNHGTPEINSIALLRDERIWSSIMEQHLEMPLKGEILLART